MDDLRENYMEFMKQTNPNEFYQLFNENFAIDFAYQTLTKQIMKQSEEEKNKTDKKDIREFIKNEINMHNGRSKITNSDNHN